MTICLTNDYQRKFARKFLEKHFEKIVAEEEKMLSIWDSKRFISSFYWKFETLQERELHQKEKILKDKIYKSFYPKKI